VCGAALFIAAHLHGFERTKRDVVGVVHVGEGTLKKRLGEFGLTPSAKLTLDEFNAQAAQYEEVHRQMLMGGGATKESKAAAELEQFTGGFGGGANPPSFRQLILSFILPKPFFKNQADLVIGSRYCNGVSVVNWPISRLFLSYFANIYARIITGIPIFDLTSGFKGYRRKVLEAIDFSKIKSDGYGFQIEMKFYTYRYGFKIKEIPVIFIDRRSGHSKMSKRIIWEAFWVVWMLKFKGIFKLK